MAPPLREEIGKHAVNLMTQILTHGFGQVRVDLRGPEAGMAEQYLYDTDVDAEGMVVEELYLFSGLMG